MSALIVLAVSVVIQLAAVIQACRLIRLTRRAAPWVLISLAFILIVIRRSMHIVELASSPPGPYDLQESAVNAMLSLLFLLGVWWIRPEFETIVRSQEQLRHTSAELEWRVQQRTAELGRTVEDLRHEIASRQQAEDALRRSEAQLSTVFQISPTGIFISRVDDGTFIAANPASVRLTGYSTDELLGRSSLEMKLWADPVVRGRLMRQLQEQGAIEAADIQVRHKSGRLVDALLWGMPLERDGQHCLLGTITDITDRKRAEEQLRSSNRMLEELTGQLRTLAAQLAQAERRERHRIAALVHDQIQQLLAAAKVRVGMLSQQVAGEQPLDTVRQIRELLNEAIGIARSLAIEINPPVMHEIGLCAALDWLAEDMQNKHGLVVSLETEAEIAEDSDGVCDLLYQCVRELLHNVVKHAGVSTALMQVATVEPDRVRVIIEDRGRGFDPAVVQEAGGSGGFGLFSIRQRLNLLGGRFEIESSPGHGSRFTLEAPVAREPAAPDSPDQPAAGVPAQAGPADRGRATRVVIADDHVMMRQGLADVLDQQEDIEIVGQAADGAEAVRLAIPLRPDVVIMDVRMPGMNGLDATRRLKAALPNVQVIGLSLHDDPKTEAAMREAGAVAYLAKGGPIEALIAAVRAVAPQRG